MPCRMAFGEDERAALSDGRSRKARLPATPRSGWSGSVLLDNFDPRRRKADIATAPGVLLITPSTSASPAFTGGAFKPSRKLFLVHNVLYRAELSFSTLDKNLSLIHI